MTNIGIMYLEIEMWTDMGWGLGVARCAVPDIHVCRNMRVLSMLEVFPHGKHVQEKENYMVAPMTRETNSLEKVRRLHCIYTENQRSRMLHYSVQKNWIR